MPAKNHNDGDLATATVFLFFGCVFNCGTINAERSNWLDSDSRTSAVLALAFGGVFIAIGIMFLCKWIYQRPR